MRVLQIHNLYRSDQPSGENRTVAVIADGLGSLGVEVVRWWPESDALSGPRKYTQVGGPFGVGPSTARLRRALETIRPSVALVHNVYPTLGPAVVDMLARHGVPVVHVIHNYRHTCVAGSHWRDGGPCFDCLGAQGRWPAVRHRCYRGSGPQSVVLAGAETWRGRSRSRARVVVHLSAWMRGQVARTGPLDVADQRVIHDPIEPVEPADGPRQDFLYVGRLAEEKGIRLLLEAWRGATVSPWCLHVVGDGPLRREVADAAADRRGVVFHGPMPPEGVERLRRTTAVAVVPALWDEPFGRVAAEAHAAGQPVLATPSGALPEIVVPGTGRIVAPEITSWSAALRWCMREADLPELGERAHRNWETRFSVVRALSDYVAALETASGDPRPGHQ